jgi:hypothetical protein
MSYQQDTVFKTIEQIRTPQVIRRVLSETWANWSGQSPRIVEVEPGYTNYKPFERARVMVKVTLAPASEDKPAITLDLFLHIFAQAEAAQAELAKAQRGDFLPCQGPPIFYIPQWRTIGWTLPNAPNLLGLAQLLDPAQFCHLLVPAADVGAEVHEYPAAKLIRYVPTKRALLTWENPYTGRRYYLKLLNDADAASVVAKLKQINAVFEGGELDFVIPLLITYNATHQSVLMTEAPGHQFTKVMLGCRPKPFTQVGRLLAQLHRSSAQPETRWTPDQELKLLRRHIQGVSLALPQLDRQLMDVITRLELAARWLTFKQDVPIHGNLFGDQLIYSSAGIGLVDWDNFSLGDPLYDIGRLLAHLIYLAVRQNLAPGAVNACAEALLQAYEAESAQAVDRYVLAWQIASQLLLRGKISSLRQLPEHWQDHLGFVVAEAERTLDGRNQYLYLPALDEFLLEVQA